MAQHMFSTELTQREASLGYKIEDIANPHAGYAFSEPIIKAVVFHLGPSDRIVKLSEPLGRASYKRQRFGTFDGDTKGSPDWLPFGDTWDTDPSEAILKARAGVQDDSTCKITPQLPPNN